jgi:O-antigen/teichoic acid export membrane protein
LIQKNKENPADISILLTITNSLGTAISIMLAVIGVRYLSRESYAIYLQIMFLLNTSIMVLQFGMPKSIYYFMPRVNNRRKFVFHTLAVLNFFGLIALLVFLLGKGQVAALLNKQEMTSAIAFLAVFIFLSTNNIVFPSVLLSIGEGKILAATRATLSLLLFCFVATPLLFSQGLYGVFWGLTIYHFMQYGVTGFIALKKTDGELSQLKHSECFLEQFKFLIPLGLISLISIFSASIDRFIVSFFMGIENFAIYDRGAIRIPVISSLSITVGAVILPKLVEYYKTGEIEKLLSIWHASIEKVALIIFPCFIFFNIFAREIITLLYTDRFGGSVIIFRIYLFVLLPTVAIYGNIFNAANRNRLFLWITIIIASVQAPLCVLLVKLYGNAGPAFSTAIVYLLNFVITLVTIKHILGIRIKEVFPWLFLGKLMSCALGAGVITGLLGGLLGLGDLFTILVCFPLYLACYYFFTDRLHLLKSEDKATIQKWTGLKWLQRKRLSSAPRAQS